MPETIEFRSGRQFSPISIIIVVFIALLLYILIAPRDQAKAGLKAAEVDDRKVDPSKQPKGPQKEDDAPGRRTRRATYFETPATTPASSVPNSGSTLGGVSTDAQPTAGSAGPKRVSFAEDVAGSGVGETKSGQRPWGKTKRNRELTDIHHRCSVDDLFLRAGLVGDEGGPRRISEILRGRMKVLEMIAETDIRQSRFDSTLPARRAEEAARSGVSNADVERRLDSDRKNWEESRANALQEIWDPVYGQLPRTGFEAAGLVASRFAPEVVNDIIELLPHILVPLDTDEPGNPLIINKNKTSSFIQRAGEHSDQIFTAKDRFIIAWFAEEYRSVSSETRMRIDFGSVNIPSENRVALLLLRWLQYIGQLFARQRLFTENGLDLDGLASRISFSSHTVIVKDVTRIKYDLFVTLFMWGEDTPIEWSLRLERGIKALLQIWDTAMDGIENDKNLEDVGLPLQRVRLMFRPGWPARLVSQTDLPTSPLQQSSQHAPRSTRIVELNYPSTYAAIEAFVNDEGAVSRICGSAYSLLSRIPFFGEADLCDIRQFDWGMTKTGTSGRFKDGEVIMATFIIGSAASHARKMRTRADELGPYGTRPAGPWLYDLGGYYPIYVSSEPGVYSEDWKFTLPGDGLIGTSTYVLPFISISESQRPGATINLLSKPKFGLVDFLASPIFKRYSGLDSKPEDTKLSIIITFDIEQDEPRFRGQLIQAWIDSIWLDITAWVNGESVAAVNAQSLNDQVDRMLKSRRDILQQVSVHTSKEELAVPGEVKWRPVIFDEEDEQRLENELRVLKEDALSKRAAQGGGPAT